MLPFSLEDMRKDMRNERERRGGRGEDGPEVVGVDSVVSKEVSNDGETISDDYAAVAHALVLHDLNEHLKGAGEDEDLADLLVRLGQLLEEEKALVAYDLGGLGRGVRERMREQIKERMKMKNLEQVDKARNADRRLEKSFLNLSGFGTEEDGQQASNLELDLAILLLQEGEGEQESVLLLGELRRIMGE